MKHVDVGRLHLRHFVAPYVGAWIETIVYLHLVALCPVAPYVGAWIETVHSTTRLLPATVAPYVGAWIETS